MQVTDHPLHGWIPYRFIVDQGRPLVQWLYVADVAFDDPFFEESIAACRSHAYNSSRYRSVSSLESMIEWAQGLEAIPVTFVFHVSRCGSTLLSQLISLNQKYIVLAEVPFFDEILRLPYKSNDIPHELIEKLFEAAVKLVGKKRSGKEEHMFIKTDSWHILFHKLLRQLYPAAPFILLYRSPDEVVYSHQKLRGMQAVQGVIEPELFGFVSEEINELSLDAYAAKVLEKYLLLFKALSQDPLALPVDYKEGISSIITQIGYHLKMEWQEEHLLQMQERSKFHSKHPRQNFEKEIKDVNVPGYLTESMKLYKALGEHKLSV